MILYHTLYMVRLSCLVISRRPPLHSTAQSIKWIAITTAIVVETGMGIVGEVLSHCSSMMSFALAIRKGQWVEEYALPTVLIYPCRNYSGLLHTCQRNLNRRTSSHDDRLRTTSPASRS